MCRLLHRSIYNALVVGYTCRVGLGFIIEEIGGQQRRCQGIREHLLD